MKPTKIIRTLGFIKPRGIPYGPLLAITSTAILAAWMALPADQADTLSTKPSSPAIKIQSVRAVSSIGRDISQELVARGETRALRRASVSARADGIVKSIEAHKGQFVEQGEVVAIIHIPDLAAREAEAAARKAEAQRKLDNAESLAGRGLTTQDALATAKTDLASAEALASRLEEERADTELRAPFSGHIHTLDIELGDSISSGDNIASLLDMSKLLVAISVPQMRIKQVSLGDTANVSTSTGRTTQGQVTYISTAAETETRSFPVEITIDNETDPIRANVSAEVTLSGPAVEVHAVPPAFLSLNEAGLLVIKTVQDDTVKTYPVSILSSTATDVMVTGLPNQVDIITVGQGFIKDGEAVTVEFQE